MRYFLPLYLAVYFFVAFLWRSYVVWRKTGLNPVVFKGSDDAHDFIGRVFKLMFAVVVAVVLAYSCWPEVDRYAMSIEWLKHVWLKWLGITLLLVSLLWTVLAQAQMGESWRIGIDQGHRTSLVRSGVFGLSRNPIFLGMMLTLTGLLLVIPNSITLLTLVMGSVLIQIQVRLEEQFLAGKHGAEYEQYRRSVRRWI